MSWFFAQPACGPFCGTTRTERVGFHLLDDVSPAEPLLYSQKLISAPIGVPYGMMHISVATEIVVEEILEPPAPRRSCATRSPAASLSNSPRAFRGCRLGSELTNQIAEVKPPRRVGA